MRFEGVLCVECIVEWAESFPSDFHVLPLGCSLVLSVGTDTFRLCLTLCACVPDECGGVGSLLWLLDGVLKLAGEFVANFYHLIVSDQHADIVHLFKEDAVVTRGSEGAEAAYVKVCR